MKLAVLRIGNVDVEAAQQVLDGLRRVFPQAVCSLSENVMRVPEEAYNQARRQYHSTRILTRMTDCVGKSGVDIILGVTSSDLYAAELNFVFGEAQSPGNVALISLCRLKPEFYGQPADKRLFYERAVKEAVHEVGHTLGLAHCRNPSCVMFFSNSIMDTDRKNAKFCEKCSTIIAKHVEKRDF